jgi:uncharacterized membrane protein
MAAGSVGAARRSDRLHFLQKQKRLALRNSSSPLPKVRRFPSEGTQAYSGRGFSALSLPNYVKSGPSSAIWKSVPMFIRMRDSHPRSIAKALSWRIVGSLDTFVLSLIFTRSFQLAGSIAGTEMFTKMMLYYFHERLWAAIPWHQRS